MKGPELGGDSYINRGITVTDDFLGVWGMWGRNNEVRVTATLRRVVLMAFRKLCSFSNYGAFRVLGSV
jgi:hypothetical protein